MSKQTFEDVHIEITFRENAGDMNAAEMLRAYATLLAEKENNGITHWNGTTHYAGCVGAGPKHYECALAEIGRLRLTITHLRAELAKAQSEYICTCGIRVTPHRCPTDVVNTFINRESIVSSYRKFPL